MIRKILSIAILGSTFSPLIAKDFSFEKDKKAILAMAGEYKVGFLFKETMSLKTDYTIKSKIYNEEAHEKVIIVKNEPNCIELQHILSVDDNIVKHWSQIWKYEDQEVLQYQFGKTWIKQILDQKTVQGTWTQLVTQTDDSPRYESFGKWTHDKESSTWTGSQTRRPLPRREYTKRKDYDYLVAVNRHTVTPKGWYHEQDNLKQVDRSGKKALLCREIGYNDYLKTKGHDFSQVDDYWNSTKSFWTKMKTSWRSVETKNKKLSILKIANKESLRSTVRSLLKKQKSLTQDQIDKALAPYIQAK